MKVCSVKGLGGGEGFTIWNLSLIHYSIPYLYLLRNRRMRHQGSKTGSRCCVSVDTGMIVVLFICIMYITLVFGLLFYVKNEWCDLLFKNMTVSERDELPH